MLFLASELPTEVLREKGFMDWVIYLMAFLFVVKVLKDWFVPEERKVSGKVQTEPAIQHAEQSDLDALTKTVNAMREEITAQFRTAQTEGQNRVRAIAEDVNAEVGTLSTRIGELSKLITTALIDNAKQGAEISGLQSSIYRHDAEVREIQQRIAELMRRPAKHTA